MYYTYTKIECGRYVHEWCYHGMHGMVCSSHHMHNVHAIMVILGECGEESFFDLSSELINEMAPEPRLLSGVSRTTVATASSTSTNNRRETGGFPQLDSNLLQVLPLSSTSASYWHTCIVNHLVLVLLFKALALWAAPSCKCITCVCVHVHACTCIQLFVATIVYFTFSSFALRRYVVLTLRGRLVLAPRWLAMGGQWITWDEGALVVTLDYLPLPASPSTVSWLWCMRIALYTCTYL